MTLTQEINAWLQQTQHHLSNLEIALDRQAAAARRLTSVREALEDTIAELWSERSIEGKNKDERDAMLRRLTAAERYAVREAEDAHSLASAAVERARMSVARNREHRNALQMRVALLQFEPLEPVSSKPETVNREVNGQARIIPLEPNTFDLEQVG